MKTDRKDVLLRAAYDLIRKSSDAPYVTAAHEMSVFYDDAECDGNRLMEDIATVLKLDDGTPPLSKRCR